MRSTQAVVGITLAGRPVHGGAALGPAERENREGDIMSTTSTSHPTTRTDPAPVPRPGRALRPRGGRRLLAPLAGMAFAAALVTGCGAEEPTDPEETTAQETKEEAPPGEDDTEDGDDGGGEDGGQDPEDGDDGDGSDDPDDDTEDPGDDPDDGTEHPGDDENLFEGTWHFGHDQKVLSAEELAAVVEQEALDRGPDEMHLTVECSDGVDTGAGDTEADCVASGDGGAEHPWLITALPADAGLEVDVENVG